MSVALQTLLLPQVILKVVSRIFDEQGPLGRWLGFHANKYNSDTVSITGPNVVQSAARYASFRYFENSRVAAWASAPGTGPNTIAPNPVGSVNVACGRFHNKIVLDYEQLSNLSPIVGPNAQVDVNGQDYVMKQKRYIHQRNNMAVELMAIGMMQDNLYFQQFGQKWAVVIGQPTSGVYFQIPFNIPASNKQQLNMLGTGNLITSSWANIGTNIITQLLAIENAFRQQTGRPMLHIWINSIGWANIINNTQVRNLAGSAATPTAEWKFAPENGMDGTTGDGGDFTAILKGMPHITWHISNHIVITATDVDPIYPTAPAGQAIYNQTVPSNMVYITTNVKADRDVCALMHGGEAVVERPGEAAVRRTGFYYWTETTTQPSELDMISLLNAVPILYNQYAICPATVIY